MKKSTNSIQLIRKPKAHLRKNEHLLQGGLGIDLVREGVSIYIIDQLNIPATLKNALHTAMSCRSIIYQDHVFIRICQTWVEQAGFTEDRFRIERNGLAKKVVSALSPEPFTAGQVAKSLFPAFFFFASKGEIPELYECSIW